MLPSGEDVGAEPREVVSNFLPWNTPNFVFPLNGADVAVVPSEAKRTQSAGCV